MAQSKQVHVFPCIQHVHVYNNRHRTISGLKNRSRSDISLDIYVISIAFFSLQEMFYICGILHESMFGVILISDFKI